jgi:hypothetical protein
MTQTLNRFFHLIFPVLTAIGLAVSYLIWWVYDELMRSVYGTVPLDRIIHRINEVDRNQSLGSAIT